MAITLAFLAGAICATIAILLLASANLRRIERKHEDRILDLATRFLPELR